MKAQFIRYFVAGIFFVATFTLTTHSYKQDQLPANKISPAHDVAKD